MAALVFLIEDEEGITLPLKLFLEGRGMSVEVLPEVTAATHQAIADAKPDLIFLDILLGDADGKVLCRELKGSQATKHIPVVMMSAYPDARESALAAGADAYMEKPFSLKDFLGYVERYVKTA